MIPTVWGMEDHPRNLVEFDERFASEEACIAYLISLRWPQGFVCPKYEDSEVSPKRVTTVTSLA